MSTPTAVRYLAGALAIAMPLAVLSTAYAGLTSAGEYTLSQRAIEIDENMAMSPDVVILGNSVARTSMELDGILRLTDGNTVAMAHIKNSRQPAWYAVLDNRVFSAGHRPKLIVIVDQLLNLLDPNPATDAAVQALMGQMDANDALILKKTFGEDSESSSLKRLQRGRAGARSWVVDGLKWYSIGLLWAPEGEDPLPVRGAAHADAELDKVFGEDGMQVDFDLYARVMPVVELMPEEELPDPDAQAPVAGPRDGYLPDLIKLAHEHDAKFVIIRAPTAPSNAWQNNTAVAVQTDLITMLNELGAGYYDLSGLPLTEKDFADPVHFSNTGREKMTQAVTDALHDLGAFNDGPLVRAEVPARLHSAKRHGTPEGPFSTGQVLEQRRAHCESFAMAPDWWFLSTPIIADAGAHLFSPMMLLQDGVPLTSVTRVNTQCEGSAYHGGRGFTFSHTGDEALVRSDFTIGHNPDFPAVSDMGINTYWLYPGTTGEFVVGAPEGFTSGEVEIEVWLDLFGDINAPPSLSVDQVPAEFEAVSGLARSSVTIDTDDREWTVLIESLPHQAYAAIRTISVTTKDTKSYLIGAPALEAGSPLRMFGGQSRAIFNVHGDDVPLAYDLEPTFDLDNFGHFDIRSARFLGPWQLYKQHGLARCSPLRVLKNGEAYLPEVPIACSQQPKDKPGVCVDTWNLRFPAGENPDLETWRLVLDHGRECGNIRWMYPGDTLSATNTKIRQRIGADRLSLSGVPVGPGEEALIRVVLWANGEAFIDDLVPMHSFLAGDVVWDLKRRIPPNTNVIELELSSTSDGAFFVAHVAVLEQRRPFDVIDEDGFPKYQLFMGKKDEQPTDE